MIARMSPKCSETISVRSAYVTSFQKSIYKYYAQLGQPRLLNYSVRYNQLSQSIFFYDLQQCQMLLISSLKNVSPKSISTELPVNMALLGTINSLKPSKPSYLPPLNKKRKPQIGYEISVAQINPLLKHHLYKVHRKKISQLIYTAKQ